MPINSMMTHGLMVTKFGPPACMPRDPENVKKELRCATACGTSLQELYVDRDLMSANGGVLWDELAKGIKWIRRNADVLDDVHWVGGNPWNKETNEGAVYGWAAWNKNKATLALRNSSDQEKSLTGTLRSILDIPANVKGSITFKDSYDDQRTLDGFSGSSVDIDKEISFTLKPFEVLVYEGERSNKSTGPHARSKPERRWKKHIGGGGIPASFLVPVWAESGSECFSNVTASSGSAGLTGITRHSAPSPPRYNIRLLPGNRRWRHRNILLFSPGTRFRGRKKRDLPPARKGPPSLPDGQSTCPMPPDGERKKSRTSRLHSGGAWKN